MKQKSDFKMEWLTKVGMTTFFIFMLALATNAQDDGKKILMTIGDEEITKAEFERIYTKNNNSASVENKNVDEYLDLFINFKLKVIEAEQRGMDTISSFKNELSGYRKQLAQPYLTDPDMEDKLIEEAYERMKYDVHAGHIMVALDKNALPKDTVYAYNKIMKIREDLISGADFKETARAVSDDPSVKRNDGDLGYFTAFNMVYPFETAAYNTPVGEISYPARTQFGYHLVKVFDKRESEGEVKVAHIMIATPANASQEIIDSANIKIKSIEEELAAGADFAELAKKYSDDKHSGRLGGELPFFARGRMVPEFEAVAFELEEPGDISEPVKTAYGWHLIKLLEQKPIPTFDEAKVDIKNKIKKDNRLEQGQDAFIEHLKKENGYSFYPKSLEEFYMLVDSSIYKKQWEESKAKGYNDVLFVFDNKKFNQQDFAAFLSGRSAPSNKMPIHIVVNALYDDFEKQAILDHEESKLEEKYPEFRYLMEEYHDGILLFDLTDKMVWTKAVEDTSGLEEFYKENKEQFVWKERAEAVIYRTDPMPGKNVQKILKKAEKKGLKIEEVAKILCPGDTLRKCISKTKGKFEKGDNEWLDKTTWKKGISDGMKDDDKIVFVVINDILDPQPKKLDEARGLITAEYQNYLEKEWIKKLRNKYDIDINEKVLEELRKEYNSN